MPKRKGAAAQPAPPAAPGAGKERQPSLEETFQKQMDAKRTCGICFELTLGDAERPHDTSLGCSQRHQVCFDCVRKLMRTETSRCSPSCAGVQYSCPFCRQTCCIGKVNMLAMVMGSHEAACEMFHCGCAVDQWAQANYVQAVDSGDEEEEED